MKHAKRWAGFAEQAPCPEAEITAGMPDSGTIAAVGYAERSDIPLEME